MPLPAFLRPLAAAARRHPWTTVVALALLGAAAFLLVARLREGLMADAAVRYRGWVGECNYYELTNPGGNPGGKCPAWLTPTGAFGRADLGAYNGYHCSTNKNRYRGSEAVCKRRLDNVVAKQRCEAATGSGWDSANSRCCSCPEGCSLFQGDDAAYRCGCGDDTQEATCMAP